MFLSGISQQIILSDPEYLHMKQHSVFNLFIYSLISDHII